MAGESANEHLPVLQKVLGDLAPQYIIDVGMGRGFYGKWLREACSYTGHLAGVEAWEPYTSGSTNTQYYNTVLISDIRRPIVRALTKPTPDVILAIDVLEHMPEGDMLQTLRTLQLTASKAVLVSVPVVPCPQGPLEGNPYEIHHKDWTVFELLSLGGKMLNRGRITGLFYFPHDYNDTYYQEIPSGERTEQQPSRRPRYSKSRWGG